MFYIISYIYILWKDYSLSFLLMSTLLVSFLWSLCYYISFIIIQHRIITTLNGFFLYDKTIGWFCILLFWGSRTGTFIAACISLVLGLSGLILASVEAGNLRSILLLASAITCGYIYQVWQPFFILCNTNLQILQRYDLGLFVPAENLKDL